MGGLVPVPDGIPLNAPLAASFNNSSQDAGLAGGENIWCLESGVLIHAFNISLLAMKRCLFRRYIRVWYPPS